MLRNSGNGIFIGRSEKFNIPFLLGKENLLNLHTFIFGSTGSGKSYLMKSMITRIISETNSKLAIVDITGEYKQIVDYFGISEYEINPEEFLLSNVRLAYYNISNFNEIKKVEEAEHIISSLIEGMRKRGIGQKESALIFLDEAWKLLLKSNTIDILLREGRKYNVGAVLASQLIEDIDPSMLSNIATIFVFRLQNRKSLDIVQKNYFISDEKIAKLQELPQGSCMAIQTYKDKSTASFFIGKVAGSSMPKHFYLKCGGKMIEISEYQIKKALNSMGYSEAKLLQRISGEEVKVSDLIRLLYEAGLDKNSILRFLRFIGLKDQIIADSFASYKSEQDASR